MIEDLYDMRFTTKNMYEKYPESNGTNAKFYMVDDNGNKKRIGFYFERSRGDSEIIVTIKEITE